MFLFTNQELSKQISEFADENCDDDVIKQTIDCDVFTSDVDKQLVSWYNRLLCVL